MSLSTLRPRTQLALAIIVPLACFLVGAVLIWPSWSRLRSASQELDQTKTEIQEKRHLISLAEAAAQGRSLALAVALPTEDEPILFLKQLAALTADSGTALASVRASTPRVPAASAASQGAPASRGEASQPASASAVGQGQRPLVPSTVRELTDEVTVEGRFGDILALIVRLENFERILSVSRCRMKSAGAAYPNLQAVFTLSRFVAAPAVSEPTTQPGAGP